MLETVSLYVSTAAYAITSILNGFIVYEFKDKKGLDVLRRYSDSTILYRVACCSHIALADFPRLVNPLTETSRSTDLREQRSGRTR